ncbi:hypothetical protein PR048_004933 [Dryococelus australis]|uniref:Uncharacterized protein n=1 Tax=Dryococelus australis TaxID=614101 RepID=A0ABQ9I6S6_9NEOP|nr:hypothetical protein PR048_004933 [Dryococelus australis]
MVEKIECSNHLLRNYCNKLRVTAATCEDVNCFGADKLSKQPSFDGGLVYCLVVEGPAASRLSLSRNDDSFSRLKEIVRSIIFTNFHAQLGFDILRFPPIKLEAKEER